MPFRATRSTFGAAPPVAARRRTIILAATALVLGTFAAYSNTFSVPFVYDDKPSIVENLTLRQLWPLTPVLAGPSGGITAAGRPVLNLSFALNYAWGGLHPFGYHLLNLLIHTAAGLVLFGLLRRAFLLPSLRDRLGNAALSLGLTAASLWTLHPLQTEAVTYTVQRAESLMGLWYLLTLYGFVRSADTSHGVRWRVLSFGACLLGMATKENFVSAPLLVFLFDRTFVAGTFRHAWQKNRPYYASLAATWLLLLVLLAHTGGNRGGSVGFGTGITWWAYALTQFPAIVHYLLLTVWPHPLVFDYGSRWVTHGLEVAPQAGFVVALVVATAIAVWRRPALGFLGVGFLALLAPTSLLPGTTQMIVEHRMYLSLAAAVTGLGAGAYLWGGHRAVFGLAGGAIALGGLTFLRNHDYRSEVDLWQDTVNKCPESNTAHGSLGAALQVAGRTREAIVEDEIAIQMRPTFYEALSNLGQGLTTLGKPAEAVRFLDEALRLNRNYAEAHLNLGVALDLLKRPAEALPHYAEAQRIKPSSAQAENDLGDALSRAGNTVEGLAHLEQALRLKPDYLEAHYNLAAALVRANRLPEAQAQFEVGRRLKPEDADAWITWCSVLLATHRLPEALLQFEAGLRVHPDNSVLHYNFGSALAAAGRLDEALVQFTEALRLNPDYPEAQNNLGNTLTVLRREAEALPHYQEALRLKPDNPTAHNNLGLALARLDRIKEAVHEFEAAVRLAPGYEEAQSNLARAQAQLRELGP